MQVDQNDFTLHRKWSSITLSGFLCSENVLAWSHSLVWEAWNQLIIYDWWDSLIVYGERLIWCTGAVMPDAKCQYLTWSRLINCERQNYDYSYHRINCAALKLCIAECPEECVRQQVKQCKHWNAYSGTLVYWCVIIVNLLIILALKIC